VEILSEWLLPLTVDHVLRGQGADPEVIRGRRPALIPVAEWALKEGLPLLEPVVLQHRLAVKAIRHEKILLEGDFSLNSPLLVQHLAGANQVVVMVCTLGSQLEEVSGELMNSEPLLALALEGLGAAAVEMLATQACSLLEDEAARENFQTSIPLSPGMVGWPVDPGQRQLFSLVAANLIGVSLTPSEMMVPRLSLSQLIGIGSEMALRGRTCDYCSLRETCRYQDHYSPKPL
jgi:hypothetical protein